MGLLWLFPEGNGTCPESSSAASGTDSSPALLCSTVSCANSETGSESFFSRGAEDTGVLPFSKAQGKKARHR